MKVGLMVDLCLPRFTTLWPQSGWFLSDQNGLNNRPKTDKILQFWGGSNAIERKAVTVLCVRTSTTLIPTPNLRDEIWTIDHLARLFGVRSSAACATAQQAGFPKPLLGKQRYRKWFADDIRAFLKNTNAEVIHEPKVRGSASTQIKPRQVRRKTK